MSRRPSAAGFALTAVLALAALALSAIVSTRNDQTLDVSAGKRRTLAPESLEILELLDRPITALGFYASAPADQDRMRELLERYAARTTHLEFRFVDLDRRPELAALYDVTQNRTLVLSSGDLRIRLVDASEPDITGALVRLMRDESPRIVFVSGHGEASIEDTSGRGVSNLADELRRQNLIVEDFRLPGASTIPPADVLVLPSPETDFGPEEIDLLKAYVLTGGRLMVLVEPLGSPQIDSLVADFGVIAQRDFVIDPTPEQRNLAGVDDPRIALGFPAAPDHDAIRGFNAPTLYPLARSLRSVQPPPTGVRLERLIETAPSCWGETDFDALIEGTPRYQDGQDHGGPLAMAYSVEIELKRFYAEQDTSSFRDLVRQVLPSAFDARDRAAVDTLDVAGRRFAEALPEEARLVVFGDVDFVNNANLLVRGNRELMLELILWLADPDARVALAPWGIEADLVNLTRSQVRSIRLVGMLLLPAIPFVAVLALLWRRRSWV